MKKQSLFVLTLMLVVTLVGLVTAPASSQAAVQQISTDSNNGHGRP